MLREHSVLLARFAAAALQALEGGISVTEASALGPRIDLSHDKTGEAGRRVALDGTGDPLVLNFASARHPGGGYVRGAKAQEEDLARCSALYHSQLRCPEYYDVNREQSSMLYTDWMIYSPRVPFFRDEKYRLLAGSVELSVLTAPAPNAGQHQRREGAGWREEVRETLFRRAEMVLAVARHRGHRDLVLGAWGCGVFRNDPHEVADAFACALESDAYRGAFDRVEFAIYERERDRPRAHAFAERLQ